MGRFVAEAFDSGHILDLLLFREIHLEVEALALCCPLHFPHPRAINNEPRANVWLRRMFLNLSSRSGVKV
jgi:hypothetical protein